MEKHTSEMLHSNSISVEGCALQIIRNMGDLRRGRSITWKEVEACLSVMKEAVDKMREAQIADMMKGWL